jgi:hypothetical protein
MSEGLAIFGKRGQGKTKYAVHKIRQYLSEGRIVATNLDIYPDKLVGAWNKTPVFRLPDFPERSDLELIGVGNPDPLNESRNGLLVLDEVGTFLNSRSWNDKSGKRQDIISWLLLSRKYGWDLLVIAQHPRLIDAQIRDSLFELQATVRRLDKMAVPFFSRFFKLFGIPLKMPRMHVVPIKYGFGLNPPTCDTIYFQGDDLHDGYNTLQVLGPEVGVKTGEGYTVLSPWHTKGRYLSWWLMYKKAMFVGFVFGLIIGAALFWLLQPEAATPGITSPGITTKASAPKVFDDSITATGFMYDGILFRVILSDGRTVVARQLNREGLTFSAEIEEGKWVKGTLQ